jgi:hypothetical protein
MEEVTKGFFAGTSFDDILAKAGKNSFDRELFVGAIIDQENICLGDGRRSRRFGGSVLARGGRRPLQLRFWISNVSPVHE